MTKNPSVYKYPTSLVKPRVSVQRVKSLGGHFACLCREFDFYEVKKWYFVTKIVLTFCKKKKSSDRGRISKNLEITITVRAVKGQNNF